MAKKAILFVSAFLLFFCFTFVGAQEATSTEGIISGDSTVIPTLYNESSTQTDVLISPAPENTIAKQEDVKTIKDQEFLEQCSLSKCRIPIPTLKNPDNKVFYQNEKIYLTGLTWNNTIIEVYVDGNYVGLATVRNDEESNTGNFYLELNSDLAVGKHSWSVIARSLNFRDRSFVSKENFFTLQYSNAEQTDAIEVAEQNINEESASSISENSEDINVISVDDETVVSVSGDKIEAGVSVTSSESNNMLVVENKKSDELVTKQSQDTETLQSATVNEEQEQEILEDLNTQEADTDNFLDRNKKIGIMLLGGLILVVMLSIFFKKRK